MKNESLSETSYSETTWGSDLDDSSSSLTDTPSVLDRESPVTVQSEDSLSKQFHTEWKGSRNIQIYNVQIADLKEHSNPHMVFGSGTVVDDKELLSRMHDHITDSGYPVNQDQGKGNRKGKRIAARLSSMKLEERCTNCEEQHTTIEHLMLIHQEKEQRCENLQKQYDRKNEECESLKTQLNHNHEKTNLLNDLYHQYKDRINSLEVDKSSLEKELAEEKEQFKNEKLKLHHEQEEEWNASRERFYILNIEINSQAEKIAELEQQCKDSEEEINALQEKVGISVDEIETLKHDENFQLATRLRVEKENKDLEEDIVVMQQEKDILNEEIERLKHDENFQLATRLHVEEEVGQLKNALESSKNALESSKRRNANQRTIHDDMVNTMNELEHEIEQQVAALDAVNAQLVTRTAELNNVQTHNGALHNLVAQFRQRLEDFEYREQDGQLLHNDLVQIIDDLRFYQHPQGANDIPRPQRADETADDS